MRAPYHDSRLIELRSLTLPARLGGLLFLAAVACIAAPAHAQDFQPDPASVQRHGPAYRFPQAGWIVLHIEGEPYERGYQHGQLLAPEIAGYLKCFAAMLGPKAPTEAWQNTRRLTNALFVRRFHKEFLEEMKGIADGATAAGAKFDSRPIDLIDIVALNCWPEIETLDSALDATPIGLEGMRFPHQQPRAKTPPRPEHCSAFAATGPATKDGKIVFGHITMFSLYAANFYNVWIDVKPAKGRRFVMCAFPGAMQSGMDYYINEAGLLLAETTIDQTRFDITGKTEASRVRQAIQYAKNIDEACDILKKDNNGLYTNEWLLGDINTNEVALFELGTHKSKLHRSSKNEWIGGTEGFYWGCNNTKDLELRLETVASVEGRPANIVFRPSERDMAWLKLYQQNKGKIDAGFGKLAFTTPPLAAYPSLDAKYTTSALAKDLKSYALFGPPLGRTWEPTIEQRKMYPDIKPLVSNPWTILHVQKPQGEAAKPQGEVLRTLGIAVDLDSLNAKHDDAEELHPQLVNVPAWHGTLLPASDGDIWLAAAFAEYERYVAKEKAMKTRNHGELKQADRDELAVDLFRWQTAFRSAVRRSKDVPLAKIKSSLTDDAWYNLAVGKGVLVLHELRGVVGDAIFEETMGSFGRKHAGQKISTAEFEAHVKSRAGKKDLSPFFSQRVHAAGAMATLDIRAVAEKIRKVPKEWVGLEMQMPLTVKAELVGHKVVGRISPSLFDRGSLFSLGVTVETDKGEVTQTVESTMEFAMTFDKAQDVPRRVIADKYGGALRANSAAYSIVSFHSEQEQTLIVYGTLDEVPTNREAAENLQNALRQKWQNHTVPIKSDKEVTEDELKSRHLLLIGRPDSNLIIQRYQKKLPITFGSRSFTVRNKVYAHPGSAVVVAADNPLNNRYSVVVIAGLSAEAAVFAPAKFIQRHQRPAEVLVLPNAGTAQALVLPRPEQTVELKQP